jgi:hypothetical protein
MLLRIFKFTLNSQEEAFTGLEIYDTMQYIKPDVATIVQEWRLLWERYCYVQVLQENVRLYFKSMIHNHQEEQGVALIWKSTT